MNLCRGFHDIYTQ